MINVSGTGQSGLVSATLLSPFVFQVNDSSNNPVSGVDVNFTVIGGNDSAASAPTGTTNASGQVNVTLTLGNASGTYSIMCEVNGTSTINDTISATATAASSNNTVSIADVTLPYGSTQTIPIRLLNSTGVGGVNVTLTFNKSIVNTTTAVAGAFDSTFNADYSNVSGGVLRISCIKSGQNLTGNLTIATVTFHAVNTSGSCGLNLSAELFNRTGADVSSTVSNGTFTIDTAATTTPPTPASLQSTTGKYWVNYTWTAGSLGPDTDSYNVSLDNGSWYNDTATSLNVTGLGAEGWANITVWAFNETGSGNMSVSGVSDEVQAPADTVTVSISLIGGGWNLIAIPVHPLNATVASVFAGVDMHSKNVFRFNTTSYMFEVVTTVEPKVGYWVFSAVACDIAVEGTPVTS